MGRVSSACTVHVEAWCSRRHFAKFASMPIRLILRAHTQNTMETCQFHACGRPTHTQFYFRNNLTRAETFTRILLLTKWKKKNTFVSNLKGEAEELSADELWIDRYQRLWIQNLMTTTKSTHFSHGEFLLLRVFVYFYIKWRFSAPWKNRNSWNSFPTAKKNYENRSVGNWRQLSASCSPFSCAFVPNIRYTVLVIAPEFVTNPPHFVPHKWRRNWLGYISMILKRSVLNSCGRAEGK